MRNGLLPFLVAALLLPVGIYTGIVQSDRGQNGGGSLNDNTNMYSGDIAYLREVWDYHARMVESIVAGDFAGGREALVAHVGLLMQRPSQGTSRARPTEGER